jgi:hypothetical protein
MLAISEQIAFGREPFEGNFRYLDGKVAQKIVPARTIASTALCSCLLLSFIAAA